jgi:hypothetical protein
MNDKNNLKTVENIKNMIFSFRGLQVMIDRDLARTLWSWHKSAKSSCKKKYRTISG